MVEMRLEFIALSLIKQIFTQRELFPIEIFCLFLNFSAEFLKSFNQ